MKERPIIFSGDSVRAILADRKTQTRRAVKPPRCATVLNRRSLPDRNFADGNATGTGEYLHWSYTGGDLGDDVLDSRVFCPFGVPGDRLWVREAWCDADGCYQGHTNDCPGVIGYFADHSGIQFNADPIRQIPEYDLKSWNWDRLKRRNPMYMPRWASRLLLKVVNIRVERMQDIRCWDIRAEGIDCPEHDFEGGFCCSECHSLRTEFAKRWDAINHKRTPWDSNPWVWVVEFKRVGA